MFVLKDILYGNKNLQIFWFVWSDVHIASFFIGLIHFKPNSQLIQLRFQVLIIEH